MNCHNCGQPINEDDLYCPYCGANNPEAEALAASQAAGMSMYAAMDDQNYDPQQDYYEDEYEQIVADKSPILPTVLAVGAAVILIAGILILLLKTKSPEDNKLGFTPPPEMQESNQIENWATLPTLDLDREEESETTIPDDFVWTMPSVLQNETTRPTEPTYAQKTTVEVEIIVNTPTPAPATDTSTQATDKETTAETTKGVNQETSAAATQEATGTTEGGTETSKDAGATTTEGGEETTATSEENGEATETTSEITEPTATEEESKTLELSIQHIDAAKFPQIRVYFQLTKDKKPVRLKNPSNLTITESIENEDLSGTELKLKDNLNFIALVDGSSLALDSSDEVIRDALTELANQLLGDNSGKNKLAVGMFRANELFSLPGLSDNLAQITQQIDSINPSPDTIDERPLFDTLFQAVTELKAAGFEGDILLYTAGGDYGSSFTAADIENIIAGSGISVHIISLNDGSGLPNKGFGSEGSSVSLNGNAGEIKTALIQRYNLKLEDYYIEYKSSFTASETLNLARTVTISYVEDEETLTATGEYTPSGQLENDQNNDSEETSNNDEDDAEEDAKTGMPGLLSRS